MPHLCFLALVLYLLLPSVANSAVVTISDQRRFDEDEVHSRFHVKDIFVGGSHIQGVAIHSTDKDDHWSLTAPLIYALPNQGSLEGLLNEPEINGKVVVFDRADDVPIFEQLHIAQHCGAEAAIIVDKPNAFEKNTALQAAITADLDIWESLTIPSVVVSRRSFERLVKAMAVVRGDIHAGGHVHEDQFVMRESRFASYQGAHV